MDKTMNYIKGKEKMKGHFALLFANSAWGLMAPISKGLLNLGVISPLALSGVRIMGGALLFCDKVDGYDTNFWLNKSEPVTLFNKELYRAGAVRSALYQMDCYTDLPCMQIYSGNFLGNGPDFKNGVKQERQHAICLETQFEPDSINHGEGILRVGETYHYTTVYKFSRR